MAVKPAVSYCVALSCAPKTSLTHQGMNYTTSLKVCYAI